MKLSHAIRSAVGAVRLALVALVLCSCAALTPAQEVKLVEGGTLTLAVLECVFTQVELGHDQAPVTIAALCAPQAVEAIRAFLAVRAAGREVAMRMREQGIAPEGPATSSGAPSKP